MNFCFAIFKDSRLYFLNFAIYNLISLIRKGKIEYGKKEVKFQKELTVYERVYQFLNEHSFNEETIIQIYKKFIEKTSLIHIKFWKFYHCSREIGFKFKRIQKSKISSDCNMEEKYLYFNRLIDYLKDDSKILLFFDITSINEDSFKTHKWSFRGKGTKIQKKFRYNLTHILAVISENNIEGIQFIKGNIINLDLINFLKRVFQNIRKTHGDVKIGLVLDNATMHKTDCFIGFMQNKSINLVYTIPNSPMFNPIEFFFRFIKSKLKRYNTLL